MSVSLAAVGLLGNLSGSVAPSEELSPKPSPSESAHWVGSLGHLSAPSSIFHSLNVPKSEASDAPSPSESTQPNRSRHEYPSIHQHLSPNSTSDSLSPYPSLSLSSHCILLYGNKSGTFTSVTPKTVTLQQSGPWLSPYESRSVSKACFQFVGYLSPNIPSSTHPSWSSSSQPSCPHQEKPSSLTQSSFASDQPSWS